MRVEALATMTAWTTLQAGAHMGTGLPGCRAAARASRLLLCCACNQNR